MTFQFIINGPERSKFMVIQFTIKDHRDEPMAIQFTVTDPQSSNSMAFSLQLQITKLIFYD